MGVRDEGARPPRDDASRPGTGEPSRSLQELLELKHTGMLSDADVSRILGLEETIQSTGAQGAWLGVYDEALTVVGAIVASSEGELEQLDREDFDLDEQIEGRRKANARAQSEAQQARDRVKTALQRHGREWTDRIRRQRTDHMLRPITDFEKTPLAFAEQLDPDRRVVVTVSDASWREYGEWVEACRKTWSASVAKGVESALSAELGQGLAGIVRGVSAPRLAAEERARLGGERAVEETLHAQPKPTAPPIDLPGAGKRALAALRGPLGTISLISTPLLVFAPNILSALGASSQGGAGVIRGVAIGGAIAVLLPAIYLTQRKQVPREREKAVLERRQALGKELTRRVEEVLNRDQGHLERWVTRRTEACATAIDRWWTADIEPRLQESATAVEAELRDVRLRKRRVGEKRSELNGFLRGPRKLVSDLRRQRERWERRPS